MMRGAVWLCLAALAFAGSLRAEPSYRFVSYDDLLGWQADDHTAALEAFLGTCADLTDVDWAAVCALGANAKDARAFFEHLFQPVEITDGGAALFTGYFEPEIEGSLRQTQRFRYPIYRLPAGIDQSRPWLTRREIEESRILEGRGLEIAWLEDPVERFFLQVQGSGRIHLTDGGVLRIGFGGKNGYDYRSIGRDLVRRGAFQSHQVSAAAIRNWAQQYPAAGREAMWANPSYVFFRVLDGMRPSDGPLGAMNRPLTAGRTVAIDPSVTPLGAPVWLEKDGASPINRLMVAQDTGSAVSGAQRADIFVGSGVAAGRQAAQFRDGGRMVVLFPIQIALTLPAEFNQ